MNWQVALQVTACGLLLVGAVVVPTPKELLKVLRRKQ